MIPQSIRRPPLISITAPVVYEACLDARKSTGATTSCLISEQITSLVSQCDSAVDVQGDTRHE